MKKSSAMFKWLTRIDTANSIFLWVILVLIFWVFSFIGIGKMYEIFSKLENKEFLSFTWQIIFFDFVLAALLFQIDEKYLTKAQIRHRLWLTFLFIWSGFFTIIGFGSFMAGIQNNNALFTAIGQWLFAVSEIFMSLGIAIILVETFRSLFLPSKK